MREKDGLVAWERKRDRESERERAWKRNKYKRGISRKLIA